MRARDRAERGGAGDEERGTRPLGALGVGLALGAALALAARLVGAPAWGAALALPAVLWGSGLALVVLLAPAPPSLFKAATLGLALGPPASALLCAGLGAVLGPAVAGPATLAVLALGLGLAARRPVERAPAGRGAWLAVTAGGLLAAGALALLLDPEMRPAGSARDLLTQGLAQAAARGLPPEHPWLAGAPPGVPWGYPAALALLARASGASTWALPALWAAASALALVPAAYLAAATVWPAPRRPVLGALLAALGVPAGLGLARLWTGEAPSPLAGLAGLAPLPPALALSAAAWAAAVHALRHGARPWVELAVLPAGLALVLHPPVGAASLAGLAAASLVAAGRPDLRPKLLIALWVAALPGLLGVRTWGLAAPPGSGAAGPGVAGSGPGWAACAGPGLLALLLLGSLLARRLRADSREPRPGPTGGGPGEGEAARGVERARRRLRLGLAGAAAAPLGIALVLLTGGGTGRGRPQPEPAVVDPRIADLAWLAAFPLGLAAGAALAGGAAGRPAGRRPAGRWTVGRRAGLGLGLVVAAGGAAELGRAALELRREGREPEAHDWRPVLAPGLAGLLGAEGFEPGPRRRPGRAEVPAEAWRVLRGSVELRARGAVLLRAPIEVPVVAGLDAEPDPAALFADLPLWCDRRVWPAARHARHEPRRSVLMRLWRDHRGEAGEVVELVRELDRLGRPGIALVTEEDLAHHRRLAARLGRLGFAPLASAGGAHLFVWPRALAPVRPRPSPEESR